MKETEALIIESEEREEWYGTTQMCNICNTTFMCDDPSFCPGCGRKFVGLLKGNNHLYLLNEP